MLILFVSAEAVPGPEVVFESAEEVQGYYQTFGVTASSERQMIELIRDYLASDLGSELAEISERWEPDLDGSDSDIKDCVGDMSKVGIWYRSGRAWFGPEDGEATQ